YPFDTNINFQVDVSEPIEFTISFRKPEWSKQFNLTGVDDFSVQGNLIQVRKNWQTGDQLSLRFEAQVQIQPWRDESIIRYGALLFCLPLDGDSSPGREYAPGFRDAYYTLASSSDLSLRLPPKPEFTLEHFVFDPSKPFDSITLKGSMIDTHGKVHSIQLIPLGKSILRRVTFQIGGQ
ncbi:MAG TPA: glycoside hydrolase family 127 protein, partial [Anaerolineales bacterium]|nr:glycoside hydrolase family 127 protein [Anaerolineales bacterium]